MFSWVESWGIKSVWAGKAPEFGYENESIWINGHITWPDELIPLLNKFTGGRKYLDPGILPVRDEHISLSINDDRVRNVKLPRAATRLAPGEPQLARTGEAMDTRIAVTITDVHIPGGRERDVGGPIEWWTTANDRAIVIKRIARLFKRIASI
jgi:hypothetical protein